MQQPFYFVCRICDMVLLPVHSQVRFFRTLLLVAIASPFVAGAAPLVDLTPRPEMSPEQVVQFQLAALAHNDDPQADAGIERTVRSLSFHSFRHGAATAVFNAAALKEITRRVTGHAQRGSLERYVRQDVQAIRAATQLIPRLPK